MQWEVYCHNEAYRQCTEVLPSGKVVMLLDRDRPHLDEHGTGTEPFYGVAVFPKYKPRLGWGDSMLECSNGIPGLLEAICVFEEYKKLYA